MNENHRARLTQALTLQSLGQIKAAESICLALIDESPTFIQALYLLGQLKLGQQQVSQALSLMARAAESAISSLAPNCYAIQLGLAETYRSVGRFKAATKAYHRAVSMQIDNAEAWLGLAELADFGDTSWLLMSVQEALAKQTSTGHPSTGHPSTGQQAAYLNFAAGKLLDRCGRFSEAYWHIELANRQSRRQFDIAAYQERTEQIIRSFDAQLFERLAPAASDRQPVFIVGMPRSGSSLVEQILASHSRFFGAGELDILNQVSIDAASLCGRGSFPGYIKTLNLGRLEQMVAGFLLRHKHRLPGLSNDVLVLDKQPMNFVYIGLILLMFPNARIVHVRRSALDTCLSCYFQPFSHGQDFTFNPDHLAKVYRDYERLMAHWQGLFGERIYSIQYESLVENQLSETEKLLDYLGEQLEPACLAFHKTERSVTTASFLQVRQAMNHRGLERWSRYQAVAQSLTKALSGDLV